MPHFVCQTLARIDDLDIETIGVENTTVTKDFLVLTHENLDLETNPTFSIGGTTITCGAPGSGALYELRRISARQTVIKKVSSAGGNAIGEAVIGSTFIIQ